MLGSVGFDFLIGEGDVVFSACDRRVPEDRLDDNLALAGDDRGGEGGEAVLRIPSMGPALFTAWRTLGEVPAWLTPDVAGISLPGIAVMGAPVPGRPASIGTGMGLLRRSWAGGRLRKVTPPAGRVRSAESEPLRLLSE